MKAIILAAGKGERMRPLTNKTPKPLLLVNQKPLIVYHIEKLVALGITDIIINTAWLKEQFETVLGQGQQWQCNIIYSPEPVAEYETAGGIKNALPLLDNAPFLVINGDIWTDYPFAQLPQNLKPNTLAHLILVNNPEHHPNGDFAINHNQQLNLADNTKKTYSGIGLYHPKLFANVNTMPAPLGPILKQAILQQQVTGELYNGLWSDIGTPERLTKMNELLTL